MEVPSLSLFLTAAHRYTGKLPGYATKKMQSTSSRLTDEGVKSHDRAPERSKPGSTHSPGCDPDGRQVVVAEHSMRHLVIIDPPERLEPIRDTTFLLMRELDRRGHGLMVCWYDRLLCRVEDGRLELGALCRRIAFPGPMCFDLGGEEYHPLTDFDAVHVRKDPPYDLNYHHLCLQLSLLPRRPLVFNDPLALATHGEKLSILQFPLQVADTLVSADREELFAFLDRHGGRGVVKVMHDAAGRGVELVTSREPEPLRVASDNFTRAVMLQEFLEEIYQGETRVFLLGGTPLAWFRKLPAGGSFKADYERGAIGVPYEPSREDLAVVEAVAPYLRARGLHLVALDIIAGRLSDFNITSPGLLVETNEICGLRTERAVVEYLETILAEVREGSISAPV